MSESPARLGWRLLGDTLLFAGQSCSVKLQAQRTKASFMWCSFSPGDYFWFCVSGNENERWQWDSIRHKIKHRSYLHAWHLMEFTLTSSFFPTASLAYHSWMHFLSFQFGLGLLQRSKVRVWIPQQANTVFPRWEMVSVFSKFYNEKDKAITKVTLNFNK